jgi:hypothetical protein
MKDEKAAPEEKITEEKKPAPKGESHGKVDKAGRGYITIAAPTSIGSVRVHSKPERGDNIVATLPHGTRRQVLDYENGYVKIKEGWVFARYVK